MGIFSWFDSFFEMSSTDNDFSSSNDFDSISSSASHDMFSGMEINPANGLPMIDGMCGVDIEGNSWGCSSSETMFDTSNDHFGSCGSMDDF
jgi:hypothetical protein